MPRAARAGRTPDMTITADIPSSGFRAELRRQIDDLRHTWAQSAVARGRVRLAVGAALGVIILSVMASVTRAIGLHDSEADFLSLTRDWALPELVMDGLLIVAGAVVLRLYRETGHRGLLLVAALLMLIALNDLTTLHEVLGSALVPLLGLAESGGVPATAIGEMIAFALIAACALPGFVWLARAYTRTDLAILALYGAVVVILAGFSVGVDAIHAMKWPHVIERLLGWAEDGGEIVVSSLFTTLAILQWHGTALRGGAARA